MNLYLVLLRGINVGGKNKIAMSYLREYLEELGFSKVSTYIASGNIILKSKNTASDVKDQIENALPKRFKLDSELIKVLVLSLPQLQDVIENKPTGFGELPEKYHSDTIFLMGFDSDQAMPLFNPREGVDRVWPGNGVVYSERLSSERTKSRLSKIMASPMYKSMTIRNWNTTTKLLDMLNEIDKEE